MLSRTSLDLSLATALCCILVHGQVDVPSPSNFFRRGYHSATVLGDYAYIDGGLISQSFNGLPPNDVGERTMNSTLSIPLTKSWTPATLSFQASKKESFLPKLGVPSLWADAAANTLITFSGDFLDDVNIYNLSRTLFWVFTADGRGGGEWGISEAADLSGIERRSGAASVVCANTGLELGGLNARPTDHDMYADDMLVPGLTSHNLSSPSLSSGSGSWSTTSAPGYPEPFDYGNAVCLPSYGQAGLALFMGDGVGVSLTNLTSYDPQSGQWYWQTTSGQTPPSRQGSCVVAVDGPNSTEIFVYGGDSSDSSASSSDVWVLTIPGFQWFQGKTSGGGTPRMDHRCVVGGKGNRQMISIGGLNKNLYHNPYNVRDPWPNGVGVLDLPSMTWTNAYNATAAAYISPQVVQDWYSSGNLKSVLWSSDEVKSVFLPGNKPNKKKTNTGAIAGGVVGGVAAVALAAGLAYYIVRTRRRRHSRGAISSTPDTGYRHRKVEQNAEGLNEVPAHSSPGSCQVSQTATS